MHARTGVETHNWFGDIRASPTIVARPTSEEELIAIVRETGKFPSPVRAAGSNHSTTRCVVADAGTVVDMTGMNRILHIGEDTVTAQAGALYIDVAKELQKHHLQLYVNIELGNLSMGSAACFCAGRARRRHGDRDRPAFILSGRSGGIGFGARHRSVTIAGWPRC